MQFSSMGAVALVLNAPHPILCGTCKLPLPSDVHDSVNVRPSYGEHIVLFSLEKHVSFMPHQWLHDFARTISLQDFNWVNSFFSINDSPTYSLISQHPFARAGAHNARLELELGLGCCGLPSNAFEDGDPYPFCSYLAKQATTTFQKCGKENRSSSSCYESSGVSIHVGVECGRSAMRRSRYFTRFHQATLLTAAAWRDLERLS